MVSVFECVFYVERLCNNNVIMYYLLYFICQSLRVYGPTQWHSYTGRYIFVLHQEN